MSKQLSDFQIKKWIYHNCPKEHTWIVFQNLKDILKDTKFSRIGFPDNQNENSDQDLPLTVDQIAYLHSVNMTNDKLFALIEANDGTFFTIYNVRKPVSVVSQTCQYIDLRTALDKMSKSIRSGLRLVKTRRIKMTQAVAEQPLPEALTYIGLSDDQVVASLKQQVTDEGRLYLEHNYTVTGEHLAKLGDEVPNLTRVSFHACLRLRDFHWLSAGWTKQIEKLDFMMMTNLSDENMKYVVENLSGLKELYIHRCPQVTFRVILGVLSVDRLEIFCLDDPKIVCQPNSYSGVIGEEEWQGLLNKSLQTFFVNSTNLSLDIIDYLRNRCPNLQQLVVDDQVYNNIKKSLLKPDNPDEEIFSIVSQQKQTKMDLPHNFELSNLLKHQYQAPFSDCMLKIMERIRQVDASQIDASQDAPKAQSESKPEPEPKQSASNLDQSE